MITHLPFVKIEYGAGRGEEIFVDVLHVSMIDQNSRFKSLLSDSCNSNELFIEYRRFEDIEWNTVSLKEHAKSQDIPNIDPCEHYEVRIATGPSEITQKSQELFHLGPYYETDQLDLGRVKLQDSQTYLEEHHFDFDVSMNDDSVTVDFGQACAIRMEVHLKNFDNENDYKVVGEVISNTKVKYAYDQKQANFFCLFQDIIRDGRVTFKVEFCKSYDLSFTFYLGTNEDFYREIYSDFESDPSFDHIESETTGQFDAEGNFISNYDFIKEEYNACVESFNQTLTKTERGVKKEITFFTNSLCECSCDIEMNILLKTKLRTEHNFKAFTETISPPPKGSSLDVNNDLESVKVGLDPCSDKRFMRLQVVEVQEERTGRSEPGPETQTKVVMSKTLENVTDLSNIDLLETDFKSCLIYKVELLESTENVSGTGRIVNTKLIQNPNSNFQAPVVEILNIEGDTTAISITDVETDGSCTIRLQLKTCKKGFYQLYFQSLSVTL